MVRIVIETAAVPGKITVSVLSEIFAVQAVIRGGMIDIVVAADNAVRNAGGIKYILCFRSDFLSPGVAEALPGSEIWGYGGIRFSIPDVQKCRRRFYSVLQFNFLMQRQQR